MSLFMPLLLTLAAYVGLHPSLSVLDVTCDPYVQGYVQDGIVHVCKDAELPRQTIINHEIVHLVQSNLGVDTLLPDYILNPLINETVPERERLAVLVIYAESDYMMAEYEARVLQNLHPRVIMTMLRFSQDYATLTSG